MSIKTALCVQTAAFLAAMSGDASKFVIDTVDEKGNAYESHVFNQGKPFNLPTTLEDRATCESDSSLLQLLPYIALMDIHTNKVFGYFRGKGGGESKLVGKMSIGVGGHVEEALPAFGDLVTLLTTHAVREVDEEVGYKDLNSIRIQIEKQLIQGVPMIYQPEDPVGKFHLGMFLIVAVDPALFGKTEENVIERGQWFDFPNPAKLPEGDFWEGWTQTVMAMATLSADEVANDEPTEQLTKEPAVATTDVSRGNTSTIQTVEETAVIVGKDVGDLGSVLGGEDLGTNTGTDRANPISANNGEGGQGGANTEVGSEVKVDTNLSAGQEAGGEQSQQQDQTA